MFLTRYTVTGVTYSVKKTTTACLLMIEHLLDTISLCHPLWYRFMCWKVLVTSVSHLS